MGTIRLAKLHDYPDALLAAMDEIGQARKIHPRFNSAHEGFAVLQEEVDELWDEVKANKRDRSDVNLRTEAIQVAAMALCFAVEVT
jgi:NTP pyrophosphatase (non-canonical NTP hydrolase)